MKSALTRFALAILIAFPAVSFAATEEENVVLAVQSAAKDLTKKISKIADKYSVKLTNAAKSRGEFEDIRRRVTEEKDTGQASKKASKEALDEALYNRTTIETLLNILPDLINFHTGFISLANRYLGQVETCDVNPTLCIDGLFNYRRSALQIITKSQAFDVQAIWNILYKTSEALRLRAEEMTILYKGDNLTKIQYGTALYLRDSKDFIEQLSTVLNRLPAFFDGKDAQGTPVNLQLCLVNSPLTTFTAELNGMADAADTAVSFEEWRESDQVRGLKEGAATHFHGYNRSFNGSAGLVSNWGACIETYRDLINGKKASLANAQQQGNIFEASRITEEIGKLEHLQFALIQEETIIKLRREQVEQVIASATAQSNQSNIPNAWRKTVRGHVQNLILGMEAYRHIFKGAKDLTDSIRDSLDNLNSITDQSTFLNNLGAVASIIKANVRPPVQIAGGNIQGGFDRIMTDVRFIGYIALPLISDAGEIGEGPFRLLIQSALDDINGKLSFENEELLSRLPPLRNTLVAIVNSAQENFNNSVIYADNTAARYNEYTNRRKHYEDTMNDLTSLIKGQKFSSVYAGVFQRYLTPLKSEALYSRVKSKITKILNDLAKKPRLATVKSPAPGRVKSPAAKKFVKTSKSSHSATKKSLAQIVSEVTSAILKGPDIEDAFATLDAESQGIKDL